MTFLEKLERDGEFAHRVRDMRSGLFTTCPEDYGYEPPVRHCIEDCAVCWNREAPEEVDVVLTFKQDDLERLKNGEETYLIIRGTKLIVKCKALTISDGFENYKRVSVNFRLEAPKDGE